MTTSGAHDGAVARMQALRRGPLRIVCNPGSGSHEDDIGTQVLHALQAAGRDCRLMSVESPDHLGVAAREAAQAAVRDGGAVVAAGGDGTISTIAQWVHGAGCALGVVPAGTFNYFGREHGISQQVDEAVDTLLHGHLEPVQVACVNDCIVLVNASVGLYPQVLQDREAWKSRFGRNRVVAMLAGIWTVMRGARPMTLELHTDVGEQLNWRTTTLFVGNNRLQFEQAGVDAPGLERGRLEVAALEPVGTWSMLALMLRGAIGQLGDSEHVMRRHVRQLDVRSWRGRMERARRKVRVAIDGEIHWLQAPLHFQVCDAPLWLIKPTLPEPQADDADAAAASPPTALPETDAAQPAAASV